MRRFYLYFSVAIFTFLIGTSVYYSYFFLLSVDISKFKDVTTLNDLEKNSQYYLSRKILLQEELVAKKNESDGSLIYYIQSPREKCLCYSGCDGGEYFDCEITKSLNFLRLVEKNEVEMIKEIAEENSQRLQNDLEEGNFYSAKVEIEGYINSSEFSEKYFSIDVMSIKQISPIRITSDTRRIPQVAYASGKKDIY